MRSVIVKGPYTGYTGYDRHVRAFTRELVRQGVTVQLVAFPRWSALTLGQEQRDPWYAELVRPVGARIAIHFVMPFQVERLASAKNLNFTMFEASRIPPLWLRHNFRHDLVIVPTVSSQRSWVDSGYPAERIRLCPLGIDPAVFRPGIEPLAFSGPHGRPVAEYKTRILSVTELCPRKNLLGLLRVWIGATTTTDDAILIIKTNCPWRRWLYKFFIDLRILEHRLGKRRREAAPILFLINQRYSDMDMARIYAGATHYWSMSYGEGWDQCMMEAGATGLHLIAPEHTAYTTYLDASVADLIAARRVPARFRWAYGMHEHFRGAEWWQPDQAAAGELIRRALRTGAGEKGRAVRTRIARDFTWEKATG